MLAKFSLYLTGIALSLIVATSNLHAQDNLLSEPQGELDFPNRQNGTAPIIEIDPKFDEALDEAARQRDDNAKNLDRVEDEKKRINNQQVTLQNEVEKLSVERKGLVDKLIKTARTIQSLEDDISLTERRVNVLNADEEKLRRLLGGQRAILSEVLAALQKLGRNPPPALFVSTDDALTSIRSAIVLGAVVPGLQDRAERLFENLAELKRLRDAVFEERAILEQQEASLRDEQVTLDRLIKENKARKDKKDSEISTQEEKLRVLAAQSENLRDLIGRIDAEIENTKQQKEQALRVAQNNVADLQRRRQLAADSVRQQIASLRPDRSGSTDPSDASDTIQSDANPVANDTLIDYAATNLDGSGTVFEANPDIRSLSRQLERPARGVILTRYGDEDAIGEISGGFTIATRARARVTTPLRGKVVFSGPFRTFRQLLILDVGQGYHMLLAGMDDINVQLGDNVEAGEPIGRMGDNRIAGLSGTIPGAVNAGNVDFLSSKTQPLLYVEVRKDGKTINSASWWAE